MGSFATSNSNLAFGLKFSVFTESASFTPPTAGCTSFFILSFNENHVHFFRPVLHILSHQLGLDSNSIEKYIVIENVSLTVIGYLNTFPIFQLTVFTASVTDW